MKKRSRKAGDPLATRPRDVAKTAPGRVAGAVPGAFVAVFAARVCVFGAGVVFVIDEVGAGGGVFTTLGAGLLAGWVAGVDGFVDGAAASVFVDGLVVERAALEVAEWMASPVT